MNEPIYLTDQNHTVILEALGGVPNGALPDTCKPFEILSPNTTDGAAEKHVPVVEINGGQITVKVGSAFHPMGEEHYIAWVSLRTQKGYTLRADLSPKGEPVARFTLEEGDSPKAAYAYCNLHGFWKTQI